MRKLILIVLLCTSSQLLAMGDRRPNIPTPPSQSPAPQTPPSGSSDVNSLFEEFKRLGGVFGSSFITETVAITFRNFFWGSTIGLCTYTSSGNNRVQLSQASWSKGSALFKEMLLFHELGHCMLGRGHKNSRHSGGRPESLMNSYLFSTRSYQENRDQYLKELFTSSRSSRIRTLFGARETTQCDLRDSLNHSH